MQENELAKTIEDSYEEDFHRPFPLEELHKLKGSDADAWDSLHTYLDLYLADIAGLCCRATRLHRRPEHELARAHRIVQAPFFERFPDVQSFQSQITQEQVPTLFEIMRLVELRRQQLAVLIQQL
jgi:hypothetical protein